MMSTRLALLLTAVAVAATATPALAQEAPMTAVVRTTPPEGREGVAAALVRVTSARAQALHVARVSGSPTMTLRDLQLAIGCVGETEECLRSVAEQLEVEALLVPSVEEIEGGLVVSLMYFKLGTTASQRVARRAQGEDAETQLIDGMDGMVRELFGLPPPDPELEPGGGAGGGGSSDGGGFPIPIPAVIAAGVGVAALAVGAAFGVLCLGSQSDYEDAPKGTEDEVDAAYEIHDRAVTQAITANVLFAAGGVAIAAGVVLWLVLGGSDEEEPAVAVVPALDPTTVGVSVVGRIGGGS